MAFLHDKFYMKKDNNFKCYYVYDLYIMGNHSLLCNR
jgi:hypothetical protein